MQDSSGAVDLDAGVDLYAAAAATQTSTAHKGLKVNYAILHTSVGAVDSGFT